MGIEQQIERHKEPDESKQFYYDLRGIIARAEREKKRVEDLKLRETGVVREVIIIVIGKIGDIIKA